jgi:hypothetical protein
MWLYSESERYCKTFTWINSKVDRTIRNLDTHDNFKVFLFLAISVFDASIPFTLSILIF